MECLIDYIGIKWCGAPEGEPDSGVYINDLPGINLKSIDNIADSEQITFAGVWAAVQKRSIRILNTAIVNELSKRYQLNRLMEYFDLGTDIETGTPEAFTGKYKGFTITLPDTRSRLQSIYIQELRFYSLSEQSVTIKIFEVNDDNLQELESYTKACVIGWNTIKVNKDFAGMEKLFIAADATEELSFASKVINEAFDCDCCDCCLEVCNCDATIQGASSDIPFTEFTHGNDSFGLSGVFSVKCGFESFVCANKQLFINSLWYLEGAEMMTERIHSDRLNRYTTIDAGKARELRDEFYSQFRTEVESALAGIRLNTADCCLECNAQIISVTNLP